MDRRGFESPADAHDHITNEGLIRRMLRFLAVELWLWVLEFQEDSGSGWPHWHILIDLASVPSQRIDLARAWDLWRKKWDVGGLDLRVRRQFEDATYAIHYITLYMTKPPKMGFPQWVRQSSKLRFFQACQKLGPILSEPSPIIERVKPTPEELAAKPKRARARTIAEREAECGMKTTAVEETEDLATHESSYRYLASLPVRPERLIRLSKLGELISPVEVRHRVIETKNGTTEWLEPIMPEKRRLTSDDLVKQLRRELEDKGEDQKCINDIEHRRRVLDANNKFSPRSDDVESGPPAKSDDVGGDGIPF